MSIRANRPGSPTANDVPVAKPDIDSDVDAFIARNREALNESIRRSRREVGEGVQDDRTVGQIIAEGRKRHGAG
jgi:hypothetical protein